MLGIIFINHYKKIVSIFIIFILLIEPPCYVSYGQQFLKEILFRSDGREVSNLKLYLGCLYCKYILLELQKYISNMDPYYIHDLPPSNWELKRYFFLALVLITQKKFQSLPKRVILNMKFLQTHWSRFLKFIRIVYGLLITLVAQP